jgi:hypothetical protein
MSETDSECLYPNTVNEKDVRGYKSMSFYDTNRFTVEEIESRRKNYIKSNYKQKETKVQKYANLVRRRPQGGKTYAIQNELGSNPNVQNLPIENSSIIVPGRSVGSTYYNNLIPLIGIKTRRIMK